MINKRALFFRHLAQTSDAPIALEVKYAEGIYLYTPEGKRITDLISGIAVNNVGHRHPAVVQAVLEQMQQYTHIMVYGEVIQAPQVLLGEKLAELLPAPLDTTYLVNSGSEANEGALKLARKHTGRSGIVHFSNAYHGSTMGCLSIIGGEYYKQGYGPLIPDVKELTFNETNDLAAITDSTAAVIVEVIQGEGGVHAATPEFLAALRQRCNETGALLIFDEVQTGFGRTGRMFAFEHYNITPDIITFAKGLGGGMPIGAFTSSKEIMQALQHNPVLGHITTFGGHPVSAAAALASIRVIEQQCLYEAANTKGELFKKMLENHKGVKGIRQHGLMLAVDLDAAIHVPDFIRNALDNCILTDWFLFCDHAFRIAPPLTITTGEIEKAAETLKIVLNSMLDPKN